MSDQSTAVPSRRRNAGIGVLIAIAVGVGILSCWTALHRSTIPIGIDGNVRIIQQRHGTGADQEVWLVWFTNGEVLHVDQDVAEQLARGDLVLKEPRSATLTANRAPHALRPSSDVYGAIIVTTGVCLGLVLLARTRP